MVDIFDYTVDETKIEINQNLVIKGEEINLTAMDPTMKKILIGVGWEELAFDGNPVDLDISCFLLNKDNKTRVDSDFVFYNNMTGCNGAVNHTGDSRTGAGDGDNEVIEIDLNGVPFDVLSIAFVISIYRGEEKENFLSRLRGSYIRLLNADNNQEMARYELDNDVVDLNKCAMIVASLNREGPKWHFKAIGEAVSGGLAKIATNYDIIVQGG